MDPLGMYRQAVTRREFFRRSGMGIGALALSSLLARQLSAAVPAENPVAPKLPHFAAKAKSIIYLSMAGAPSQLDLFDPKQDLQQYNGQPVPESVIKGERFAFIKGVPNLLGSPYKFAPRGQSGQMISELLPHLHGVADELAVVRSIYTTQFNHAPAQIFLATGFPRIGRPSMGSWLTYGLGTENQDLPGFIVLLSGSNQPDGGMACWSNGFLPALYQGVQFRSQGDPVLDVSNPAGIDPAIRRQTLDALRDLNDLRSQKINDPDIAARVAAYELAFRMQTSVPELADITKEPESIHKLYGTQPGKMSFANNCLLARRLVERGCRFVQLYHYGWDHHGTGMGDDIIHGLPERCKDTDQASAALIMDLKQRGLLDSTLVIWGGEFGRTPMDEARNGSKFLGRDHHPHAFTIWMAGAGVKKGVSIGATDHLGYRVAEDPIAVHDLQATILHLMGMNHEQLTFKFQGRNFRLTDVEGSVVRKLLA